MYSNAQRPSGTAAWNKPATERQRQAADALAGAIAKRIMEGDEIPADHYEAISHALSHMFTAGAIWQAENGLTPAEHRAIFEPSEVEPA